jgi:tetratricopeptide (TPR) repeat protein
MSHISEGELALDAFHAEALPPARRDEIERHLAACEECRATHDFFAITDEEVTLELADQATWEPIIGSATHASLMEYGARVAAEDRDAEILLAPLLANPMTAAWMTLVTKRRFRTGGVVRKLNAAAHSICENDPLAALTFADNSIAVAEALPDDLYPAHAVDRLRATAWKERANAQMLLGQFPEAHRSLDRAERCYGRVANSGPGLSMVTLVRAGVLYEQQRLPEAMATALRAEQGFAHAGDDQRRMDALFLRAGITYEAGDPDAAIALFRQIIEHGENISSRRWVARGAYAIGNCEVDRANLGDASMHFHTALVIFREIGPEPDRVATEWGIARVVLHSGQLREAIRRLRDVQAAFERRSMVTNAALVGLDVAEALLALDRPKEIVALAKHLFSVFTEAGMLTGALSAIAYLKQAAAANQLTPRIVQEIRAFMRRAARQPARKFVPPPEDSV